jgi:PAS domain S-box-containing protein
MTKRSLRDEPSVMDTVARDFSEEEQSILIVDDRTENLFSLAKVLEETRARVLEASNGNDALTLSLNHDFAVAIVDVQMPGMDGYELAELLRSNPRSEHLPIMFVSAIHHDEAHIFRGFDAGAVDYIAKPFDPRILLSKVRVFLKLDEQKRALQRQVHLEQAKSRLENILLSMSDSVVVVSQGMRVETVNTATLALLGCDWDDVVGRPLSSFMSDDAVRRLGELSLDSEVQSTSTITSPSGVENRRVTWRRRDGHPIPVLLSSSPYRDIEGHTMGMVLVARDRTEFAKLQDEYNQVIETAIDGFAACSESGEILDVNDAMSVMSGYGRGELLGMSFSDLGAEDERLFEEQDGLARLAHVFERGHGDFEARHRTRDGRSYDIECVVTHNREAKRLYFFVRDITARKLREAHTRQQQKLESIGTLASGVAHEINNPINIVFNCAELILEDAPPGGEVETNARYIEESCERISTIVKALLSFARDEGEKHSPAHMSDIVESTASLIRKVLNKDQIIVSVDVPKDLPTLKCRSQQIQQVVMNLLTNARDALNARFPGRDERKVVTVSAHAFEREGRRWIRTTVEDQGLGIPPKVKERIFEPFFTTKSRDEGTGMGLSVSHGIVAEHRGELSVDSEPGKSTRFHVDLPIDNG